MNDTSTGIGVIHAPRLIAYITLLVYWGPITNLYYVWGFVLLFFLLFSRAKASGSFAKSMMMHALVILVFFILSFFINYFIRGYSLNNFFWSILTYGSTFSILIAFLLIPFTKDDLLSIFRFSIYLTLAQVFLGYFQMLQYISFSNINPFVAGQDAGDFFVGTTFTTGLGSLVAIKISLMTLLFIPFWFERKTIKNSIILALLFVGWVLASALFTLIIAILVLVYFYVIKYVARSIFTSQLNKSIFYIVIIGASVVLIFVYTQSNNIRYVFTMVRYTYATIIGVETTGKVSTRKVFYYRDTFTKLPVEHPSMLYLGVGPGNYSSRSAWIVSGEYLTNQPSFINVTPSEIARKYTISIWSKNMIGEDFKGAGSIMHQPFSTWLSVFAELGLFGLFAFILLFRKLYKSLDEPRTTTEQFMLNMSAGLKISLSYLMLLFFLENLFEYPMVMGQFFVFVCAFVRVKTASEKNIQKNYSS